MTADDIPECPHAVTKIVTDDAGDEIRICVDCDTVFPA